MRKMQSNKSKIPKVGFLSKRIFNLNITRGGKKKRGNAGATVWPVDVLWSCLTDPSCWSFLTFQMVKNWDSLIILICINLSFG